MKYSQWIGIAAALSLIVACFLPWAYFPDLQKDFTGFFSEGNAYGRPGKIFIFFCIVAIGFFLTPRIWAKRANIFISAMTMAFGLKSYILYTACYRGICPDRRLGIFLVLIAPVIMLIAAISPSLPVKQDKSR